MTATIMLAPKPDIALHAYLAMLGGDGQGWLEVRYRTRRGMRTLFYPARGRSRQLAAMIRRVSEHSDVYIGCAIRGERAGDKDAVAGSWVAWAELDTKDAINRLASFTPAPTMLISSGTPGHMHAYWALTERASADAIEDANKRLAYAVGGDPVCFDSTRILRPPATRNHKHTPALPVQLEEACAARRYSLEELIDGLELPPAPVTPGIGGERTHVEDDADLLTISPDVYVPALTGVSEIGRSRKICCPIHKERTPSLHVYPSAEQGWFCFGCRRGGSIFDLASYLWQLDTKGPEFVELKERLRELFR
ncbi:CHC2 zinc finger domain-containing protein [Solirubrobacter pauli]|nr:CHC2 zinc finger domain-containing protein [Solirubrobacter pauli]